MLTGQDFGAQEDRWRAWLREHDKRDRMEWLIDSLDHADADIRDIACRDLRQASGQDYGYRAEMPSDARRAIQDRYRRWWLERDTGR
jgi:hypothetical protein